MSERTDRERLDWLEEHADLILSRDYFTPDEYQTPQTVWQKDDQSFREAIDVWMTFDELERAAAREQFRRPAAPASQGDT